MPWSNKGGGWQGGGGGDGDGGGPWGQGGGGQQPPDLEEILRRGQDNLKKFMPGGGGSGKIVVLIGLVLVALWASSGFYKVGADEQSGPCCDVFHTIHFTVVRDEGDPHRTIITVYHVVVSIASQ